MFKSIKKHRPRSHLLEEYEERSIESMRDVFEKFSRTRINEKISAQVMEGRNSTAKLIITH